MSDTSEKPIEVIPEETLDKSDTEKPIEIISEETLDKVAGGLNMTKEDKSKLKNILIASGVFVGTLTLGGTTIQTITKCIKKIRKTRQDTKSDNSEISKNSSNLN